MFAGRKNFYFIMRSLDLDDTSTAIPVVALLHLVASPFPDLAAMLQVRLDQFLGAGFLRC